MDPGDDAAEVLPLLQRLLVVGRLWSVGQALDEEAVAALRDAALRHNHRYYLEHIPVYAGLAQDFGIGADADVEVLASRMTLTDEVFKGYDPAWTAGGFELLTRWLGGVFVRRLEGLAGGATSLQDWRSRLREHGVYVTFSSGTSGRPSIVPRDRLTLAGLRSSSGARFTAGGREGPYDCLVLVPEGMGLGIQSGAAGLEDGAVRHHRLAGVPGTGEPDHEAATSFLDAARQEGRRVLVYGTPAQVARLCAFLSARGRSVRLPPGSSVVTGGGWKGERPLRRSELVTEVCERLGVPADACIDAYSTAELNTVFVTCPVGRYHVPPVVRAHVVDADLQPLPGAEAEGVLAVLDPFALSYPGFVVTGDVVRLSREPCACGRRGTSIVGDIRRAPGASERGCGSVLAAEPA